MNKNSETLKSDFELVLDKYKKKDYQNAEILCYKILSIDPNHFNAITILSNIAAIGGNFKKATELLNKAIEINPNDLNTIHNLGTAYKELGNLEKASSYYEKILKINPNHTNANYNLGLVFYKRNDLKSAKNYLKKTVNIQSNYALAFFSLANVHIELKEFDDAVSCYQKAIELNPNLVSAHNNLGLTFRELNDFKNAISCYKQTIKLQPNHAGAHHNLALAYKELGQFDEAIQSHMSAIKHEPTNLAHEHFLSELKKEILNSGLKEKTKKILESETSSLVNNAYGNYILAKYEKRDKNYKKELEYLVKGHSNFFKSREKKFNLGVKYSFDDVIKISEEVEVELGGKKNYDDVKPIFIVGVPRSGSTLVEKIITSGKKFISIGEETAIFENYINKKILEKQSLNLGNVESVRDELNNIYKLKGLLSKKNDYYFSDKSLNNFFYIKFIKQIYPKAKIINCQRDPLSSIMSIFQNNLTELAWTHKLDNIFKYFDNYFQIMENYDATSNTKLYNLNFENLTNDPEGVSKKLMNFCELPWDKKCLEFYKRKDLISKTASNIQIRESIYKHSLKKYLPYKKYLEDYGKKYSWFN